MNLGELRAGFYNVLDSTYDLYNLGGESAKNLSEKISNYAQKILEKFSEVTPKQQGRIISEQKLSSVQKENVERMLKNIQKKGNVITKEKIIKISKLVQKSLQEMTQENPSTSFQEEGKHYIAYYSEKNKKLRIIETHERLGEGATATVFAARRVDSSKRKKLAVKASKVEDIDKKKLHLRYAFKAEKEITNALLKGDKLTAQQAFKGAHFAPAARLSFSAGGVTKYYTSEAYSQEPNYLVMNRYKPLPENYRLTPKNLKIQALNLVDLLNKIHEKGYVHSDLKPENFLIDNKNLIISDFAGASKDLNRRMVTFLYTCSDDWEAIASNGKNKALQMEIAKKQDVFALGMSLLDLATGETAAFKLEEVCGFQTFVNKNKTISYTSTLFLNTVEKMLDEKRVDKNTKKAILGMLNLDWTQRITLEQATELLK